MTNFALSLIVLLTSTLTFGQAIIDPATNKIKEIPVGKITALRGEAFRLPYSNRQESIPLKVGSDLFTGDDITTEESSLVKIQMTDDTAITLGPKTQFEIVLYNFEAKDKRNATFDLKEGHLRSKIVTPAKSNELTYKMGKVAMGIRGTEIVAEILKKSKDDGKVTRVAIIEGKAFVDFTTVGHKTLKKIGLDLGKILNTKLITPNSKEEDFLIPLSNEELKRLLSPDESMGATFLKDLDKKPLKDSVNAALGTKGPEAVAQTSEDDVTLEKKKKNWTQILEEDQNIKDNP